MTLGLPHHYRSREDRQGPDLALCEEIATLVNSRTDITPMEIRNTLSIASERRFNEALKQCVRSKRIRHGSSGRYFPMRKRAGAKA